MFPAYETPFRCDFPGSDDTTPELPDLWRLFFMGYGHPNIISANPK